MLAVVSVARRSVVPPAVAAVVLGTWCGAATVRADDEVDAAVIRASRVAPGETRVGHAEIERTGAVTLADALRPQADVDTLGGGAAGAVGRLTLRGSTPARTSSTRRRRSAACCRAEGSSTRG